MEMITKKLMEKNGQSLHGNETTTNEKAGISLNEANKQNNSDSGCCSL